MHVEDNHKVNHMKEKHQTGIELFLTAGCVSLVEELLYEAQDFAQITPMELDILFHLVGLRHQTG